MGWLFYVCSAESARILRDAAIEAGAPENCIQWIEFPSIDNTSKLMNHEDIAVVLATGGSGMVRAAYSTGKPAHEIAAMADMKVPVNIKVLCAEIESVGSEFPLSREKLSPVLAIIKAKDAEAGSCSRHTGVRWSGSHGLLPYIRTML